MKLLTYSIKQKLPSLFFKSFPILKFKVKEESLVPFINPRQIVLAERITYIFKNPKAGDLIIFKSPQDGKSLIKFISKKINGKYFVSGLNENSIDSKSFGLIEKKDIIARVFKLI